MVLKNIGLAVVACGVRYFYQFPRDLLWPRIQPWKGTVSSVLPETQPYSFKSGCGQYQYKERKQKRKGGRRREKASRRFPNLNWQYFLFPSLSSAWWFCLWLTCDILVFIGREGRFLMVIDIRKCHVWIWFKGIYPPPSFPAFCPSVYFNYTMKTLKYGMADCCISQALNCTQELDRGILSPCNGKRHICNRSRSWNIFRKCQWISRPFPFYTRHLWFHAFCV